MIPTEHRESIDNGLYALRFMIVNSAAWDERRGSELIAVDAAIAWIKEMPAPPRPDWSRAPAQAMWWSCSALGSANWHVNEPAIYGTTWAHGGEYYIGGWIEIPLGIDWRLLKEKRP